MNRYVLFWVILLPFGALSQHVDTIGPGHMALSTVHLRTGQRQYFIYMQDTTRSTKTLVFWYWLRRIDRESHYFHISQRWFGQDTAMYREVTSLNSTTDFAPLYHEEIKRGKVYAYNWSPTQVWGADTVRDNAAKDFTLAFSQPNLNWNLDIETFEMLPLDEGKTFAINFYDAGLDPPQYVVYKVSGSEVIQTLGGTHVDCWKLTTDGQHKDIHYTETYWISKKDHEFLKEEDHYGSGFRLKILMPAAAPAPFQGG